MEKQQSFFFFLLFVSLACILAVAGCGKKGDPVPPEGSSYSYPGRYPPHE